MSLNKKGTTLTEIIVSIGLISVILVFLINLFLNIKNVYITNKVQSDYQMVVSSIIDAVGTDIEKYGLKSVTCKDNGKRAVLEFNEYRPTDLSQHIKKVIDLTEGDEGFIISYIYDKYETPNITAKERMTHVVRSIPKEAILNIGNYIQCNTASYDVKVAKIKIPMITPEGTVYDINIYGLLT